MWKLRGCARCNGDVYINRDEYGWFVQCLQCGYHSELVNIDEARKQMQSQSQAQHVSVNRKLKPED
jgi:DNA-directed RNA polymerase subunit M/transcription elongation factor TFIIS